MFFVLFFDLQNFNLLVRTVPFLRKIIFISSYTAENNYFLLYELIQDLPYLHFANLDNMHTCQIHFVCNPLPKRSVRLVCLRVDPGMARWPLQSHQGSTVCKYAKCITMW